jgi:predicted adenylyl cyclase CyaB
MPDSSRNLELKAPCPDLARVRETVRHLGARAGGIEVQTDTYFQVPHGRLKLREIEGRPPILIWYDRPNRDSVRTSTYHLVPVTAPGALHGALTAALGLRGQVRKRREIYFWHNVRIHLDEVTGLGTFIEFEAALSAPDDEVPSRDRLDHLCELLVIQPGDSLAPSYADLMGI